MVAAYTSQSRSPTAFSSMSFFHTVCLSVHCALVAAAHLLCCVTHSQEREQVRYQEEAKLEENRAQIGARMKQYEDELARKRMMAEHELTRWALVSG